jgi:hypothetical protein
MSNKEFNNVDTDQFAAMIKRADAALARNDLDGAEFLIDQLMHKAKPHKQSKNVTVDDTWSKAGDDDDDDDDEDMGKVCYPQDRSVPKPHVNMGPVDFDRVHVPETYQLDVTPTARAAAPHEFNALVAFVMDRDRVSKTQAMATARREYPDVYQSYQSFNASTPTTEQATRRGNYKVGKSAPETFEGMVEIEMLRGVNREVAQNRILQKHGSVALRHRDNDYIAKGTADIQSRFVQKAEAAWAEDGFGDRCSALRKARLENPQLYRALRSL